METSRRKGGPAPGSRESLHAYVWVSGRHITSVALHTLLNTVGLYNFLTPPERRGTALCGYLRTLGNAGGTTLTLLFVITLHDISTAHLPLYLLLYLSLLLPRSGL